MPQENCCCPCLIHTQDTWQDPRLSMLWQVGDNDDARGDRDHGWYGVNQLEEPETISCGRGHKSTYCGTAANDSADGGKAWSNPSNCEGEPDTNYAEFTAAEGQLDSDWLKLTNFSLGVPADIVDGAETVETVTLSVRSLAISLYVEAEDAEDLDVRLMVDGSLVGDNLAVGAWPSTPGWITYVLPTAGWTPAYLNATGFGLAVRVRASSADGFARVYGAQCDAEYNIYRTHYLYAGVVCDTNTGIRWLKKPSPGNAQTILKATIGFYGYGSVMLLLGTENPEDNPTAAVPALRLSAQEEACILPVELQSTKLIVAEIGYGTLSGGFDSRYRWALRADGNWREANETGWNDIDAWLAVSGNSISGGEDYAPLWIEDESTDEFGPYIGIVNTGSMAIKMSKIEWTIHNDYRADCPQETICWRDYIGRLPPEKLSLTMEALTYHQTGQPFSCSNYPLEHEMMLWWDLGYVPSSECFYSPDAFWTVPDVECNCFPNPISLAGDYEIIIACAGDNRLALYWYWSGMVPEGIQFFSKTLYSTLISADPLVIVFEGDLYIACTDNPTQIGTTTCGVKWVDCRFTLTEVA